MDQGKLVSQGSYEELLKTCPVFRSLVHGHSRESEGEAVTVVEE